MVGDGIAHVLSELDHSWSGGEVVELMHHLSLAFFSDLVHHIFAGLVHCLRNTGSRDTLNLLLRILFLPSSKLVQSNSKTHLELA